MAPTKVSADASSYGLGAVLMQKKDSSWRPIEYASISMSTTEMHSAQIEKEALATWACERFSIYILGKRFSIETEHKPLVSLLGTKNIDSLPPTILRFRLRLVRFDYTIEKNCVLQIHSPSTNCCSLKWFWATGRSWLPDGSQRMQPTGNWRKTSTVSSSTGNWPNMY